MKSHKPSVTFTQVCLCVSAAGLIKLEQKNEAMCCEECRRCTNKHAIHELEVIDCGTSDGVTEFEAHTCILHAWNQSVSLRHVRCVVEQDANFDKRIYTFALSVRLSQ